LAAGTNYYVDSIEGDDAHSGLSPAQAWQTLAPLHRQHFLPGDTIHFRRGSHWAGGLIIDDSGVAGAPITFTTYGDGPRPIFVHSNVSDKLANVITIYASWIVLEGVLVRDANFCGVYLWNDADHNVIRDVEATAVGIGIMVYGRHNLITHNYIHDTLMVKNTPGGDDDFGALGVTLNGSYNEIAHNRIVNCIAPSQDYGVDGGAIEIAAGEQTIEGIYIHHNWAENCEGFIEIGGPNGIARNITLAYNVAVNCGRLLGASVVGKWAVGLSNVRLEHNTSYQTGRRAGGGTERVFSFNGPISPAMLSAHNNIFYAVGAAWGMTTHAGFTHSHNLYRLDSGRPEYRLSSGDIVADPKFVGAGDLHLQADSPAIDAGVALGYVEDFDGRPTPAGKAPDLGAFEYQAQ